MEPLDITNFALENVGQNSLTAQKMSNFVVVVFHAFGSMKSDSGWRCGGGTPGMAAKVAEN